MTFSTRITVCTRPPLPVLPADGVVAEVVVDGDGLAGAGEPVAGALVLPFETPGPEPPLPSDVPLPWLTPGAWPLSGVPEPCVSFGCACWWISLPAAVLARCAALLEPCATTPAPAPAPPTAGAGATAAVVDAPVADCCEAAPQPAMAAATAIPASTLRVRPRLKR